MRSNPRLNYAVCVVLIVLGVPSAVNAGGLEYTGAGAQALGRGGAVTARADDPMVLGYNPAGLAELRGNQLLLDVNVAAMSACVDPIGYYGWGAYGGGGASRLNDPKTGETLDLSLGDSNMTGPAETAYYTGKLDTVCMRNTPMPIPQLGATFRLTERLGIGFGLIFPAAMPLGQWGDERGLIRGADGALRPAPTRYMLMRSGTLGVFPNVGFGFRVAKFLRLGASLEWGIINVDNTSMSVISAGTSPNSDIIARVQATDWFVPAFGASIHIVPNDSIDIVGAVRWQDDLNAPGTIALTTGVFDPRSLPFTTTNEVVGVHQNMPWKLRGGIRYASRLAPRPVGTGHDETRPGARIHDAMEDERWDLEFDLEYQINSRNKDQVVDFKEMQAISFQRVDGTITMANFPDSPRLGTPTDTVIPKRWQDQLSARVGGTYNILPGLFAVSLGGHYETRGIDPSYMQLDYWPLSRFGFHAGVKFRVGRTLDIVASYSHMVQETLVVGAPAHMDGKPIYDHYAATGELIGIDKRVGAVARGQAAPQLDEVNAPPSPDGIARLPQNVTKVAADRPPMIINSGTYRSSLDVFAIGLNVHY
jgi:hypothetical protein